PSDPPLFSLLPYTTLFRSLVLSHRDKPAEQWLYVPALKRERPIAAQERSASFLGTELSNEDLQDPIVENYEYELLDEKASVDGRDRKSTRLNSSHGSNSYA